MTTPSAPAETVQELTDRITALESHIKDLQVLIVSLDTRCTVLERFAADRFR